MAFSWLTTTISSYIYTDRSPDDDTSPTSISAEYPSKSAVKSKPDAEEQKQDVKGLENLGNTCFFNASVQALLACPKFVQYLTILSTKHKQNTAHSTFTPYQPPSHSTPGGPTDSNPNPSSTLSTNANTKDSTDFRPRIFCELLLDLHHGTITSPKDLFRILCEFHPTEFSSFTQSDAHESYNKMMEILEIEQLYIATESQSDHIIQDMFDFLDDGEGSEREHLDDDEKMGSEPKDDGFGDHEHSASERMDIVKMKNPFSGLLGSMLECRSCLHSNESRQTSFSCLTLSLMDEYRAPRNGFRSMSPSVKLMDRIKAFETEESIDGYRCMVCECRGIMAEIKDILASLKSPTHSMASNPMHKMNDIQLVVLREQYQELQWELNKLMPHQKTLNGLTMNGMNGLNGLNGLTLNGMNGYHPDHHSMDSMNDIDAVNATKNGVNGYHHHSHSMPLPLSITTEHRLKYRIDASSNKSYRTLAVKKQFVSRYPCVLCIHFNRLQFGSKDSRYVSFKPLLSLSDYDTVSRRMPNGRSINAMFNDTDYSLCSQYLLMSVIVHHGNDSGGHYTTYKRTIGGVDCNGDGCLEWKSEADLRMIHKRSRWYHISDEFVNEVSINQVLMCQAYMLFYQKNQFSFKK